MPSLLSGRYSAVKVRKILYVTTPRIFVTRRHRADLRQPMPRKQQSPRRPKPPRAEAKRYRKPIPV